MRRRRDKRQSSGKRVTPQPRDILWFRKLREHGDLPTPYFHAFTKHLACNGMKAKQRLETLYHEDNTPHGGEFLDRPGQQFDIFSDQDFVIHSATRFADMALEDEGIFLPSPPVRDDISTALFRHRLMVSCITASIDIACQENGLRFIPQHEVLAKAPSGTLLIPCKIKATFKRTNIATGRTWTETEPYEKPVAPDAVFGIEYPDGYIFYVLEADRNSEPTHRSTLEFSSYFRKQLQYQEVIGKGGYKEHFGMKARMMALNVTTHEGRVTSLVDCQKATTGPSSYMLYRAMKDKKEFFRVPGVMRNLLTEPYLRAGHKPFSILTAEQVVQ